MKKTSQYLFFILSLFFIYFLPTSSFGSEGKIKLDVKSIGYSPLEYDTSLPDVYNEANNFFIESILDKYNDLGIIRVQYLADVLKFKNPNSEQIRDLCSKIGLDAYLVTKLQFGYDKSIFNPKLKTRNYSRIILSMKLFDREGKIVDSADYDSYKKVRVLQYLWDVNLLAEAINSVTGRLIKGMNFLPSEFHIEQVTEQTWQSFKIVVKDGKFQGIVPQSRMNLRLYNNSDYLFESIPDPARRKPTDKYVYKPGSQEIILHSGNEEMVFDIVGYNSLFLILKPKNIENIEKIYFRQLTEKKVAEMLDPPVKDSIMDRDTILQYYVNLNTFKVSCEDSTITLPEPIYFKVDERASFHGGNTGSFRQYVYENLIYPLGAIDRKLGGSARLQYVIRTDGSIQDVKIVKSSGWKILDKEALRLVRSSPKWTPAKIDGKPVNQLGSITIAF